MVGAERLEGSGQVYLRPHEIVWLLAVEDINFVFVFGSDGGDPAVSITGFEPKKVTISLSNFDNALGTSYSFDDIATVNGRSVSIAIVAHALGEGRNVTRTVSYSVTSKHLAPGQGA
jgi:hypothetical protein